MRITDKIVMNRNSRVEFSKLDKFVLTFPIIESSLSLVMEISKGGGSSSAGVLVTTSSLFTSLPFEFALLRFPERSGVPDYLFAANSFS